MWKTGERISKGTFALVFSANANCHKPDQFLELLACRYIGAAENKTQPMMMSSCQRISQTAEGLAVGRTFAMVIPPLLSLMKWHTMTYYDHFFGPMVSLGVGFRSSSIQNNWYPKGKQWKHQISIDTDKMTATGLNKRVQWPTPIVIINGDLIFFLFCQKPNMLLILCML